jgi:putative membrane protein
MSEENREQGTGNGQGEEQGPLLVPVTLLVVVLTVLAWSAYHPRDRFTWFMEVVPVLIGLPIVLASWRRFPLTPLLTALLALHASILMVGGKYTYAEVPLGFWMEGWFGLVRNNYDRIGHFAQGFVPAILAREILSRTSPLKGSRWLPFLVFCICLAFSAFYELIEWRTAVATGTRADAFLGTQGDPWDTQWDMAMAAIGAVVALVGLSRVHDGQLDLVGKMEGKGNGKGEQGPGRAGETVTADQ